MTKKPFYSIMFVCLGNICRSPTAEALLRHLAKERGLDDVLHIESSATSHYSVGQPPDRRSHLAASKRGYFLSGSAKLFRPSDFQRFHYILGADESIIEDLQGMTSDSKELEKIHLITFCSPEYKDMPIPDPYYEGDHGFEHVLDMLEDSCNNLLNHLYP